MDLNADIGDLLKQLFSGKKGSQDSPSSTAAIEKKLSSSGTALLWPILLSLLLVADLFIFYLPWGEDLKRDLEKTMKIEEMIAEKEGLVLKNRISAENLQQAIESKRKLTTLMFAHREIDTLYSGIHDLAKRHSLDILELKKEGGEAISNDSKLPTKTAESPAEEDVLFYRLRVSLRMEGNYLDYIRMREDFLDFGKMINVDDEKITSDQKLPQGFVRIEMKLSAYQI